MFIVLSSLLIFGRSYFCLKLSYPISRSTSILHTLLEKDQIENTSFSYPYEFHTCILSASCFDNDILSNLAVRKEAEQSFNNSFSSMHIGPVEEDINEASLDALPRPLDDRTVLAMIDIANSYCGVGVHYQANSGPFRVVVPENSGIQCSQFVNAVLQGLYYQNSRLYNPDGKNIFLDGGCSELASANGISEGVGALSASQLAKYAFEKNWLVQTNCFRDTCPGDVVFFSLARSPESNWNHITHTAIVVKREGHKTICVNAGALAQINGLLDESANYWPGDETDAVCYQTILDDETMYFKDGTGLFGYARFPVSYSQGKIDFERNAKLAKKQLPAAKCVSFFDGAENAPLISLKISLPHTYEFSSVILHSTGKNIIQTGNLKKKTINGVTFTPIYDSAGLLVKILVNGTASEKATYLIAGKVDIPEKGKYWISGNPSGSSKDSFFIQYECNGQNYRLLSEGRKRSSSDFGPISIVIMPGCTVHNLAFTPMIAFADEEDLQYEPSSVKNYRFLVVNGDVIEPFPVPNIRSRLGENHFWVEKGSVELSYHAALGLPAST